MAALALAALAAAGCPGINHAPSVGLVDHQTVQVGEQLAVTLTATDPDGDRVLFAVTGLPDEAEVHHESSTTALLLWTPAVYDAAAGGQTWVARVDASDGHGGVASTSFDVTVFPAYGLPTFDLPAGLVLNLAQEDDLELVVVVKDDDSTQVALALAEAPSGAKLSKSGDKSALFYWKPDATQRESTVHRVIFSADDGINPTAQHVLLVVLVNGEQSAGCVGSPPVVQHQALPDTTSSGQAIAVAATVTDAESVVGSVTLRWSDGDPEDLAAYGSEALTHGAGDGWSGGFDPGAIPAGGKLIHYWLEARDNDDPIGVACDRVARKPKTGWLTAAVYPPGTPAGTCIDDGAEPDDTEAQAPLLAPGTYPGRRLCGAAPDVAAVEVGAGQTLTAKVVREPEHGAVAVTLRGADGFELDHDQATDAETLVVQGAGSSPLYVEVARADGGGGGLSYGLELVVAAAGCAPDELEPNDEPGLATPLGAGAWSGLGVCPADEDWFLFDLGASERLDLAITFEHKYGDLDLELRDASGQQLLASASGQVSTEAVSWTSAAPVSVLAVVRGYQGAANTYDLTATTSEAGTSCEDDVLGVHAGPDVAVVLFSAVYQGLTACPDLADWFAVDLNGGETLTVLTQSEASVLVDLFADPAGPPSASGTTSPADDLAEASLTLKGGEGRLYYRVATLGATTPYALLQQVTDPAGPCQPDRFEPNDDVVAARPVEPGVFTWLRLCGEADVDAFRVEADEFQTLTVFTGHEQGKGFTDLVVYDPTGNVVAEVLDYAVGAVAEVTAELPGSYFILVKPYAAESLGYDLAILVD